MNERIELLDTIEAGQQFHMAALCALIDVLVTAGALRRDQLQAIPALVSDNLEGQERRPGSEEMIRLLQSAFRRWIEARSMRG
jgi:hypothetical protein